MFLNVENQAEIHQQKSAAHFADDDHHPAYILKHLFTLCKKASTHNTLILYEFLNI
jgi:hypothetical protein